MSRERKGEKPGDAGKWLGILLLLVCAAVVLVVVCPVALYVGMVWFSGATASSSLPPFGSAPTSGPRVAYVCSERPPSYKDHICVMRADGTGQTLLTKVEGRSPVWSPDGRRIAFVSAKYDIMVMNADGRELKSLAHGVSPWWMADGARVSFMPCGPCEAPALISRDGEPQGEFHTWNFGRFPFVTSPDGQWIAYEDGSYIAVKRADGGQAKRLAQGAGPWWLNATTLGFTRISRMVVSADGGAVGPAPDRAEEFAPFDLTQGNAAKLPMYASDPVRWP